MAVAVTISPQLINDSDDKYRLSKRDRSYSRSRSSISSSTCSSSYMAIKRSSSRNNRRCSFTRRCAALVREQRARFYIVRRCVTMLICWREYGDS